MRHPVVAGFVLVAHAALFAYVLHPAWFQRAAAFAPRELQKSKDPAAEPVTAKATPPAPPRKPRNTDGGGVRTAKSDAQEWLKQQDIARRQYAERRYGKHVADLLQQPDGGTGELEQLARGGDDRAFDARNWRVDQCQALDTPAVDPAAVDRAAIERTRGLPADAADFARGAVSAALMKQNEQRLVCTKVNTDAALLEQAYRDLAANATPLARMAALELAFERDADLDALIAGLRDIARTAPLDAVRRRLAEHLLESADGANRTEGLALLRDLSGRDGDALSALAMCEEMGCGAYAPRPGESAGLLERAARLGYGWALERKILVAQQHNDPLAALTWSGYRQWLNAHGCFAAPNDFAVQFLLADLRLPYQLDADAMLLRAADTATARLIAESGAAARKRADCD